MTRPWRESNNANYDIGSLVLGRNSRGQKVESAASSQGIAFYQPRDQFFDFFGYPADPPFNGERQYVCSSRYAGSDDDGPGPASNRMGCDMTEGASGGGWVIEGAYVNSVFTYGYDEEPQHAYGPYFGSAAERVWRNAKNY